MGSRTTPKKISPAEQRARNFEAVGLARSSAPLVANADVAVERAERETATRKAHLDRARRFDAFEALKDGMGQGAYDAARRLELDVVTARGEHDRGRAVDRIDAGRGADRTDAMIAASRRVEQVLARVGGRDALLLTELIAPSGATRLNATTWRGVVAYITGEENPHAQCAVVRSACANLAAAYDKMLCAA